MTAQLAHFKALSPEARYVLILRGKWRDVSAQLQLAADKASKLTIGELKKLEEKQGV